MKFIVNVTLILFLNSCMYEYNLKSIEPYFIFHDNSSKVWLVDKVYQSEFEISPKNIQNKEIIVFHNNKKCYFYIFNNFSNGFYLKKEFVLNIEEKELTFLNKNNIEKYKIEFYSSEKIIIYDEKTNIKKILISFPEY